MSRAAIATLSTENLLHNLRTLKAQAPQCHIIGMIKANAYGHGLRSVGMRLEPEITSLGVASIDEAIALRKVGVKKPITLMEGVFTRDEYLLASCEHFQVIVHEASQLEWLLRARLPLPIFTWVKVNTGMGRLGFSPEEALKAYEQLSRSPNTIKPVGLMSHLACSEEEHPLNASQMASFRRLANICKGPKSLCNSAAIFRFADEHYDWIRPGLALYGASPFPNRTASELGLKPVMTLHTNLIAIREMKAGESIGYGARFRCPEDMRVGVIAMGYGDGYPRTARDGTPILVNSMRCQLVGRVSMDMSTIDLRSCPDAQVGDPVVLWGEGLPLEEVALHTQHSPYDLLCAIQSRVIFHWTQR